VIASGLQFIPTFSPLRTCRLDDIRLNINTKTQVRDFDYHVLRFTSTASYCERGGAGGEATSKA
jgi:hypothetical protein